MPITKAMEEYKKAWYEDTKETFKFLTPEGQKRINMLCKILGMPPIKSPKGTK